MSFFVKAKTEDSVTCEVIDGGELKSRRHLNVRGKSATLPSITGNSRQYFLSLLHLMNMFLFHTPVSNMQTRIGMILSLVWITRLITMLFLL